MTGTRQRSNWHPGDTQQRLRPAWKMWKADRAASCDVFSHHFGWELRLMVGQELLQSRVVRSKLLPCSAALHDAIAFDGRYVQIKATQGTRVAFYGKPDYLIVLKLARDGSAEEIYNGPGETVWEHVSAIAKNGQCSIAVSKLRALMSRVPPEARVPYATAS